MIVLNFFESQKNPQHSTQLIINNALKEEKKVWNCYVKVLNVIQTWVVAWGG